LSSKAHGENRLSWWGRQQAEALAKPAAERYMAQEHPPVEVGPFCCCPLRPYPHEPGIHNRFLSWDGDWRMMWANEQRRFFRRPTVEEREQGSHLPMPVRH
jgi:hypothetical protein